MVILTAKWIQQDTVDNYLVNSIREEIGRMKNKMFVIEWIPSHVGIEGNDQADDFTNRRYHLDLLWSLKVTYSDASCTIHTEVMVE